MYYVYYVVNFPQTCEGKGENEPYRLLEPS